MEYENLKNGLKDDFHPTDLWLANPALPEHLTVQPMPGHIRRPKHFLFHLDLLVWYLESKIGTKNKETQTPLDFLRSFYFVKCPFNTNFLRFCDERLSSLLTTLKIVDTDEFLCIQKLCHFATLWGHYFELIDKFQISTGPCLAHYDEDGDPYYDPAVKVGTHFFKI
jgi:DNA excision repair protein ERCC-2